MSIPRDKRFAAAHAPPVTVKSIGQPGDGHLRAGGARSDHKVVERCLEGDERAWEQLYRRCQPRLVKAIELLLGANASDVHLVEEIAARVWYALLRDGGRLLSTYDPDQDSPVDAFLMGLARIEIMRHMRSERRRRLHELIGGRRRLEEDRVSDWQFGALMEEFTSTLTESEREFLEGHLTAPQETEDDPTPSNMSATSIWQRRHRIRFKLEGFLRDL